MNFQDSDPQTMAFTDRIRAAIQRARAGHMAPQQGGVPNFTNPGMQIPDAGPGMSLPWRQVPHDSSGGGLPPSGPLMDAGVSVMNDPHGQPPPPVDPYGIGGGALGGITRGGMQPLGGLDFGGATQRQPPDIAALIRALLQQG